PRGGDSPTSTAPAAGAPDDADTSRIRLDLHELVDSQVEPAFSTSHGTLLTWRCSIVLGAGRDPRPDALHVRVFADERGSLRHLAGPCRLAEIAEEGCGVGVVHIVGPDEVRVTRERGEAGVLVRAHELAHDCAGVLGSRVTSAQPTARGPFRAEVVRVQRLP